MVDEDSSGELVSFPTPAEEEPSFPDVFSRRLTREDVDLKLVCAIPSRSMLYY